MLEFSTTVLSTLPPYKALTKQKLCTRQNNTEYSLGFYLRYLVLYMALQAVSVCEQCVRVRLPQVGVLLKRLD